MGAPWRESARRGRGAILLATAAAALGLAGPASAQTLVPGVDSPPIPQGPEAGDLKRFSGAAAAADPLAAPRTPRHPFMAPNELSNIHVDAYQTDVNRTAGPLGQTATHSAWFNRECATITFDSQGRLVTVCVGLDRPTLALLHPTTLEPLAAFELPPRVPGGSGNPFTDFSGGGYFYLDHRDRAVVPTTTRHIFVIGQAPGPAFELRRDYDLTGAVGPDDKIISAMPDWRGRIWFASTGGVVGWVQRRSGQVHSRDLGESIGNSFAVDERRGVYIVTDAALYRFKAEDGHVRTIWRRTYPNTGEVKPGQTQAGSGTTPTVMAGGRLIAITDNADPMHVMAFRRAADPRRPRLVCRQRLFREGSSATDQSLIAAGRRIVAENNYGYTIAETQGGGTTSPGLQRVDVDRDMDGCDTVWRSRERAPSVVPKASLRAGIVYTYTKPRRADDQDPWYLTALDFDTGETLWRRLAGEGVGYNNNYAPITIAPTRRVYVGVLGGITAFRPRAGD